jgi:hypothetical protein
LALAFDTASALRNVPLDLGKVLFEHISLHDSNSSSDFSPISA